MSVWFVIARLPPLLRTVSRSREIHRDARALLLDDAPIRHWHRAPRKDSQPIGLYVFLPPGPTRRSRIAAFSGEVITRLDAYRSLSFSLFLPFIPFSSSTFTATAKDSFTILVVLQNVPRGDIVLVRLYGGGLAGKREIGMRRKRGFSVHTHTRTFVRTYVRPGYTHSAVPPFLSPPFCLCSSRARTHAFSFSVYPFQVGGAANQSFLREHDGRRR